MCLAGNLVASLSLTQELAGSSPFNDKYFLSLNSLKNIQEKTTIGRGCSKNEQTFVNIVGVGCSIRHTVATLNCIECGL